MKIFKLRKRGTKNTFAGKCFVESKDGEIYTALRNIKIAISVGVNYGRCSYNEFEIVEYELVERKVIEYEL